MTAAAFRLCSGQQAEVVCLLLRVWCRLRKRMPSHIRKSKHRTEQVPFIPGP